MEFSLWKNLLIFLLKKENIISLKKQLVPHFELESLPIFSLFLDTKFLLKQ